MPSFETPTRAAVMVRMILVTVLGVTATAAAATADTAPYARVLDRFVTAEGLVRYAGLQAAPEDLDAFVASLAAVEPASLAAAPEAARIAFWINAYNAITLQTISAHYPITGSGWSALRYPSSSIRQIAGAWTSRSWRVAGRALSLDDIEHATLRADYHEPRIHMALVCAALGCPPLRREPYLGSRLDEQLADQARRYLAGAAGLVAEPARHRIAISSIFKWFGDDFAAAGGVRAFVARSAPQRLRELIAEPATKIRYLDYDWRLNEAQED